jgi:hypothetical protein
MSDSNNYHFGIDGKSLKTEKEQPLTIHRHLQSNAAIQSAFDHDYAADRKYLALQQEKFEALQQKFSEEIIKMEVNLGIIFSIIERQRRHFKESVSSINKVP